MPNEQIPIIQKGPSEGKWTKKNDSLSANSKSQLEIQKKWSLIKTVIWLSQNILKPGPMSLAKCVKMDP